MSQGSRQFPIIIEQDEEGFFVATNPALPGCYSQGKTMDEALANVREATQACLAEHMHAEDEATVANISMHLIIV